MTFDGALLSAENPTVPLYIDKVPLSSASGLEISIDQEVYSAIDDSLLPALPPLTSAINIRSSIAYAAGKPYASIRFLPVRLNPATGKAERLERFRLTISSDPASPATATGKIHSKKGESSKLAGGDWFKIGVTRDGIFKMDYNFLSSLGVAVDGLDTKYIHIYGKPGGMLPQSNAIARDEDLVENAIEVADLNGNGKFDKGEYVLFYAKGPVTWTYDKNTARFRHQNNYYSDAAYYFISTLPEEGKRIDLQSAPVGAPNNVITSFDDYAFHESDQLTDVIKYMKSGREWFGEDFRTLTGSTVERAFDFSFPHIDNSSPAYVRSSVAARAGSLSTFDLSVNGSQLAALAVDGVDIGNYLGSYVSVTNSEKAFTPGSSQLTVSLKYHKSDQDAIGWLNYIELNVRRYLVNNSGQFNFRDTRTIAAGQVNKYSITNAGSNVQVWDVTDFHHVQKVQTRMESNALAFNSPADSLREFVAFDGSSFFTPQPLGRVANQDLHGLDQPDMVIVAHPDFLSAANRLADFHRQHDGMVVHVVTPQQVYEEFSSGAQDVSAIRDFMRMFYERGLAGGKMPKYLLLFGDASYDPKNRVDRNTNFVITYESDNSILPESSFVSDDYFGFLDKNEGEWSPADEDDMMDIAVGRLPIQTPGQANDMVDKIVRYSQPQSMGDWRNRICFIADDEDNDIHLNQADNLVGQMEAEQPIYNVKKIYLDAYKQESGSSGARYPEVNKDIDRNMETGMLVMNYVGHGGEVGWAHERILEIPSINSWENKYSMPLIITATCEFSRFDDPGRTSAGELTLLNPNGGAVALFTTTRVVNSGGNEILNRLIVLNNLFKKEDGKGRRLGDVFIQAKNKMGFSVNTRNFTLLGDPAIRLALPENSIAVTKINNDSLSSGSDTLKALQLVTIHGEVQSNGQKMSGFNGIIYPTIYDKKAKRYTLSNDGPASPARSFTVREGMLYRGRTEVKNGEFSFSFVVPKDISFQDGTGKLSFYAQNGVTDANGYNDQVAVGGIADSPMIDDKGPEVVLYMNDSNFRFGGLVDNNPVLIARLRDDIGINTTGNSIGHDLVATLNDGDDIVLNSYYESDFNSYQSGTVRFSFYDLPDGNYRLKVKAWDVANNSGEGFTEFTVASSAKLAIDKIFNYPNPFSDVTTFQFEHNRPNEDLDVYIGIYSLSGQLIAEIKDKIYSEGNRSNTIRWDGRDSGGGKINSGMYIYRIIVTGADGQTAQQSQRLVVIK